MHRLLLHILMLPLVFVSTLSIAQSNAANNQSPKHQVSVTAPTKYGFVSGTLEPTSLAIFLGIPYAKPPIGNLR